MLPLIGPVDVDEEGWNVGEKERGSFTRGGRNSWFPQKRRLRSSSSVSLRIIILWSEEWPTTYPFGPSRLSEPQFVLARASPPKLWATYLPTALTTSSSSENWNRHRRFLTSAWNSQLLAIFEQTPRRNWHAQREYLSNNLSSNFIVPYHHLHLQVSRP